MNNYFYADDDVEIVKFDGVTSSCVYSGFLECLKPVELKWNKDFQEGLCEEIEYLTLGEIKRQCHEMGYQIITVFSTSALHGNIYQLGNYDGEQWVNYGNTIGYA